MAKKHQHRFVKYGARCQCGKQHYRCYGCGRNKIGRQGKPGPSVPG